MMKVAVVGAGASGLPAIKWCLDEGLIPVCFERTGDIGGLWNYTEDNIENKACVMRSTVVNASKECMPYSDFPIPADFPNYMHNTKVQEYFRMYADKFGLLKYIRFQTEVVKMRQSTDFKTTGRWELDIKDMKGSLGGTSREVYDCILVCTGHHVDKKMPEFEGAEDFQGQRIHTHDYKDGRRLFGKRAVVIGIGNSGGDVAVELSKICSQVYLSTRRGAWIHNRVWDNGLPVDLALNRFGLYIKHLLPRTLINTLIENKLNSRFDHALYGLKPTHRWDQQHPTVNDDLPNRIIAGSVIVKPNIRRFTKTGVEFEDGTVVDDVDVVIYATGYRFGFPFIDHEALEVKNNEVNLYKQVFPPDIQPSTLAIIGCCQPVVASLMTFAELQCRFALKVFRGVSPLPSAEEMSRDIAKKKNQLSDQYVDSTRHTIQANEFYLDELAEQIGCKPKLCSVFFKDPRLWWALMFWPLTPFHYRVMGPNSWPGARDAILTIWDRAYAPFKTRHVTPENKSISNLFIIFVLMAVFAVIFTWFRW